MTSGVVPSLPSLGEPSGGDGHPVTDVDARLVDALLAELARIPGAALAALFDETGVCRSVRRSPLICAFGTYRVLADVSDLVPGRSVIAIDVGGRAVLARRLHDGGHAVIATGVAADIYETEVRLVEAVAGHALRSTGADPSASPFRMVSMTIPPPANVRTTEPPALEASHVVAKGSLASLYRDVADEADFDDYIVSG